jgi:hypothetical protein
MIVYTRPNNKFLPIDFSFKVCIIYTEVLMTQEFVNFISTAYKTGMCPLNSLRNKTEKEWTATHYVAERPGFTRLSAEGEEDLWVETPHATKLVETLQKFETFPVTASEEEISFWLSTLGKKWDSQRPVVLRDFLFENWSGETLTVREQLVCDAPGSAVLGYVFYFGETMIAVLTEKNRVPMKLLARHELQQSQLAAV